MKNNLLLSIPVKNLSKNHILEKISLYLKKPVGFFHIISLNPENIVIAGQNLEYRKVLSEGDIQLFDGVGVKLGCAILNIQAQNRLTGIDCMDMLLKTFHENRLRVLFIGGKGDLAETVAKCYNRAYSSSIYRGIEGIKDIFHPKKAEEEAIFSIVADYKPQIIFSSFGSPHQELWFYRHKDRLKGIICMGVGGGFEFAAGTTPRAPRLLQKAGLEWLFRLIIQTWRIKRQVRLIEFVYLILKQKIIGT